VLAEILKEREKRKSGPAFYHTCTYFYCFPSLPPSLPPPQKQDPFSERIKKCIRLRECLRITELKSKLYPGENRTLYTFGVEDMDEDGGKS